MHNDDAAQRVPPQDRFGRELLRAAAARFAGSIPVDAPFSPPYSRATRADTDGGAGFSSAKRWR